jgi:hypothetical protein
MTTPSQASSVHPLLPDEVVPGRVGGERERAGTGAHAPASGVTEVTAPEAYLITGQRAPAGIRAA